MRYLFRSPFNGKRQRNLGNCTLVKSPRTYHALPGERLLGWLMLVACRVLAPAPENEVKRWSVEGGVNWVSCVEDGRRAHLGDQTCGKFQVLFLLLDLLRSRFVHFTIRVFCPGMLINKNVSHWVPPSNLPWWSDSEGPSACERDVMFFC